MLVVEQHVMCSPDESCYALLSRWDRYLIGDCLRSCAKREGEIPVHRDARHGRDVERY